MGTCRLIFRCTLDFSLVLPIMFVLEGFYDHIIDSDMDQGADGLCFLREPVLQ